MGEATEIVEGLSRWSFVFGGVDDWIFFARFSCGWVYVGFIVVGSMLLLVLQSMDE